MKKSGVVVEEMAKAIRIARYPKFNERCTWEETTEDNRRVYREQAQAALDVLTGFAPTSVSASVTTESEIQQVGPNLPEFIQEWMWIGKDANTGPILLQGGEGHALRWLGQTPGRKVYKIRITEAVRHELDLVPVSE
jgi:hypothetical protein